MKAIMLTGIRQMEMQEIPTPMVVNDTDVLIKMKRVGVCGSDVQYYTTGKIGDQIVQYPFPVGHEGAGEVEKVGSAVNSVKPGDRIAIEPAMHCFECDQCLEGRYHTCRKLNFLGCPGQADGCLSEYIVMPESSCIAISDGLSYDQAAISEPLAIGVYAVKQAGSMEGKSIGILGFGPIGMSVMLAAMTQGAKKIYVTDKIEERNQIALKLSASFAGNPDKEDIVSSIINKEPKMLDVIFECCGKQDAMDNAVDLLKPGGKLMIIGIPEFDHWSFSVDHLRRKELSIINVRRQVDCVEPSLEMMLDGRIDVSLMPTHRFKFSDTKAAFDLVTDYKDGVMKAMIDFE
ncbi:MAG: alcohol dehydrogenase catalytic domain-containing protein [Bacteroidales bacterium]|nr:alcohol dehydrogenase catalytic domain-containing protein [Bacteroidales bacterium]